MKTKSLASFLALRYCFLCSALLAAVSTANAQTTSPTRILEGGAYSTSFFSITGNTLYFTAIPEPTNALAGLLLTAGLLRRRRRA